MEEHPKPQGVSRGGLGRHARRSIPGRTESTRPCPHKHSPIQSEASPRVPRTPSAPHPTPTKARDSLPARRDQALARLREPAGPCGRSGRRRERGFPGRGEGCPAVPAAPPAQPRLPASRSGPVPAAPSDPDGGCRHPERGGGPRAPPHLLLPLFRRPMGAAPFTWITPTARAPRSGAPPAARPRDPQVRRAGPGQVRRRGRRALDPKAQEQAPPPGAGPAPRSRPRLRACVLPRSPRGGL